MTLGAGTPLSSPATALTATPNFATLGEQNGLGVGPSGALATVNGYALPLDRWTPNTRESSFSSNVAGSF